MRGSCSIQDTVGSAETDGKVGPSLSVLLVEHCGSAVVEDKKSTMSKESKMSTQVALGGLGVQWIYGVPNVTLELVAAGDFSVPESSGGEDTGFDIQPRDRVVCYASGEIWAGVAFTGANGPEGWHYRDSNRKFPLPGGHPYSLLGQLGGRYFEIGKALERYHMGATTERLILRTNDDSPGNGSGAFGCRVEVWRRVG